MTKIISQITPDCKHFKLLKIRHIKTLDKHAYSATLVHMIELILAFVVLAALVYFVTGNERGL
jgi:uncharacterized protein YebE (UPF0316 family)